MCFIASLLLIIIRKSKREKSCKNPLEVTSLILSILLVLLQHELCSKLELWTSKQKEIVSKLTNLQKEKHYPDEIQDYVADYQLHAFRTVRN